MTTSPQQQPAESPSLGKPIFDQAAIDALVSDTGEDTSNPVSNTQEADQAVSPVANDTAVASDGTVQAINQSDIDALMQAAGTAPSSENAAADATQSHPSSGSETDAHGQPLDQATPTAQADTNSEQPDATGGAQPQASAGAVESAGAFPTTMPFEYNDLPASEGLSVDPKKVTMLNDVNLRVRIELGRTRMLVEDVLKLGEGSVVELDKLAGDPVDVFVNDRLIARGEVLVLNDNFCVRISDVLAHDPHRVSA